MLAWTLTAAVVILAPQGQQPSMLAQAEQARLRSDDAEAVRLYQSILTESPDHVEAHRGYQNLLLSQGRERTVRDEYAKLLEQKRSPQRLFLYGRLLFDPVAEEKLYREGLQLAPDDQHLQAALVDSLRRQRRVQEAIRECRSTLEQRPEALELHRTYIRLMVLAQHRDTLLDEYRKLAQESADWRGPYLLATASWNSGERSDADRWIRKAHTLSPDSLDVRQGLAVAEFFRGEPARARELLESVLQSDPLFIPAMEGLANALLALDEKDEAMRHLRMIVRLEPTDAGYRYALAQGLLAAGDLDGALHESGLGLRFDPADHDLHDLHGQLLALDGDLEGAEQHLEKAREIAPDVITTLTRLADVLAQRGKNARAREILEEAARIDYAVVPIVRVSESAPLEFQSQSDLLAVIHDRLGWMLAAEGRLLDAKRSFERALRHDPEQPRVLVGLARIARSESDLESAKQRYQQAVAASTEPGQIAHALFEHAELLCAEREFDAALPMLRRLSREHAARFRAAVDLPELVRSLERADRGTERILLDRLQVATTADEDACASIAVASVLAYWGKQVAPEEVHRELIRSGGPSTWAMVDSLRSRGMRVLAFPSQPEVLQRLLRQGLPLILLHEVVVGGAAGGHASVVAGFDTALEVLALSPRFRDGHRTWLQFTRTRGNVALLAAPESAFLALEGGVPGVEAASLLIEAKQRFRAGQTQDARSLLEQAASVDHAASLPELDFLAGACAAAAGDREVASALLQRAVERARFQPVLLESVAAVLLEHGLVDQTRQVLARLLELAPTLRRSSVLLSMIHSAGGEPEQARALQVLDEALALAPDDGILLEARGLKLLDMGQHEEAERAFRRAIAHGAPQEAQYELAWCLHQRGKTEYAAARLRRYLATPGVTRCEAAQALLEACTAGR